jgi:membrane protein
MARVKAAKESVLRRVEQAPKPVLRVAMSFLRELANIEPFDRAMTLAAQGFTSIFPLLITLIAFLGNSEGGVGDQVTSALSLPDSMGAALEQALPPESQQAAAFGLVSIVIVLVSATSLSRALGRMYAKTWHVSPSGWSSGWWRWILVIVAICASTTVVQLANHSAGTAAENVAALVLTFVVNTALWMAVPWLLLVRQVSMARLLPGAALMGVGSIALTVASRIYMPRALTIGSEHFGALGVAFTLIGWLFIVGFVLVVATVLGAVIVQDEGVDEGVAHLRRTLSDLLRKRRGTQRRDDATGDRSRHDLTGTTPPSLTGGTGTHAALDAVGRRPQLPCHVSPGSSSIRSIPERSASGGQVIGSIATAVRRRSGCPT